jgi:hypothetical protein
LGLPWMFVVDLGLALAPVLVIKLAPQQSAGVIRDTPQPLFHGLLCLIVGGAIRVYLGPREVLMLPVGGGRPVLVLPAGLGVWLGAVLARLPSGSLGRATRLLLCGLLAGVLVLTVLLPPFAAGLILGGPAALMPLRVRLPVRVLAGEGAGSRCGSRRSRSLL